MIRKNENMFEKTNLMPLNIDLLKFLARNTNKEFYITQLSKFTNSSQCMIGLFLGNQVLPIT
jgi:hypothetical protein